MDGFVRGSVMVEGLLGVVESRPGVALPIGEERQAVVGVRLADRVIRGRGDGDRGSQLGVRLVEASQPGQGVGEVAPAAGLAGRIGEPFAGLHAMGVDARIWHRTLDKGPWLPVTDNPTDRGTSVFLRPTAPAAVSRGATVELFAMGNDSRIWRTYYHVKARQVLRRPGIVLPGRL